MNKNQVIAIDGPSSSGKSSVAKLLAKTLKFHYVDTGAMFRAIGLYFFDKGLLGRDDSSLDIETTELEQILNTMEFEYNPKGEELHLKVNDKSYHTEIRQHFVSHLASVISTDAQIRNKLKKIQRNLVNQLSIVMDGRDIGSVIFPDADYKFFITASPKIRALRRYKELLQFSEGENEKLDLLEIEKAIIKRDKRDAEREIAPLIKAPDAIEICNDNLDLEQTLEKILSFIKPRKEK